MILILEEDRATIPFDIASHQVIRRPTSLNEESGVFLKAIESAFAEAYSKISASLEDEPNRLLEKKEYRAAVIAVFSLLEQDLRRRLELSGFDTSRTRSGLGVLLEYARKEQILTMQEYQCIRAHTDVRNRIAHTREEVSAAQAKTIVKEVSVVIAKLRDALLSHQPSEPMSISSL